jgi:cell division protein FtsI (penicillin-binding protein 3)
MSLVSKIILAKRRGHLNVSIQNGRSRKKVDLYRQGKTRVLLVALALVMGFGASAVRLVEYGVRDPEATSGILPSDKLLASRPDILDRHGQLLATDVRTVSMFAEPNKIVDVDDAVEKLATIFPDLDRKATYAKLSVKSSRFAWLRRQITPRQQSQILELGIPGVGFRPEKKRFYPGGNTAAHVLGYVDIDNRGVAGMERYLDQQGLLDLRAAGLTSDMPLEPVKLSIDLRVQNIVREVAAEAMVKYRAEAAGAVIVDVETGEVLAMASVPDFDPNQPSRTLANGKVDKEYEKGWFNRISNATFEMGSTFKSFTLAMGLDEGKINLNSVVDATRPIRMGGFIIRDFKGKNRVLTIPEVFQYSSNIGTAAVADMVGIDRHREFLTKLGLLSKMETEMPGVATPTQPRTWKKINSVTISFGHGVATTPLQTAVAAASLINGGKLVPPTFLPRSPEQAGDIARLVLSDKTSQDMRYLYAWNGIKGSGRSAQVEGFNIGGKTGTADKVVDGRYASDKNFNAFVAAFPMDRPKYIVLTIIDAPETGEHGGRTAASTAAPMIKSIIGRAAPLLGVAPRFGSPDAQYLLADY